MNPRIEATIKIDRAQRFFLLARYGKRKNTNAKTLIRLAVLEAVANQAQKELDENGYHVATKAALASLAEASEGGEG